jgi:hypothetical protein
MKHYADTCPPKQEQEHQIDRTGFLRYSFYLELTLFTMYTSYIHESNERGISSERMRARNVDEHVWMGEWVCWSVAKQKCKAHYRVVSSRFFQGLLVYSVVVDLCFRKMRWSLGFRCKGLSIKLFFRLGCTTDDPVQRKYNTGIL